MSFPSTAKISHQILPGDMSLSTAHIGDGFPVGIDDIIDGTHAVGNAPVANDLFFCSDIYPLCDRSLQLVVLVIIPNMNGPVSMITKDMLKLVILCQFIPRFIRIYPLYKEAMRISGIYTETAWAGAALNLFLFMLASHVVGAFWYVMSVERKDKCWRDACSRDENCKFEYLYCKEVHGEGNAFLVASCPLLEPNEIKNSTDFDFGIYLDALQSNVVEMTDFPRKFFYCLWWGLRSLSSLGQNLKTSTFLSEILFAICISVLGLVLFSLFIGNMQKYLQSMVSSTAREEEMRLKSRDAEQWMSHRKLPENLRQRIRCYEQHRWKETRGVDEELFISNLPKELRKDIKRHLCWDLVMRVPMFENMDEQLLDAMCDRLKPVLYTQQSYIVREGDPVDEMLLVKRGKMTVTTNGERTGFFNSWYLKAGDFCGEELLTWALDPNSSSRLPISTRTVQSVSDIEAFVLMADDLKFVASQFRRLHSRKLQHTFRFHSQQWRTWAACFIQAAWQRYGRRKLEKSLREEEDRLQNALAKEGGTSPSLGATIYASRFAANALGALRRNHAPGAKLPHNIPTLLLQKPIEPDFSAEDRK